MDSISACHAEDRGSIPRRGELSFLPAPDYSPRQINVTHHIMHAPPEQYSEHINLPHSLTEVNKWVRQKNSPKYWRRIVLTHEYDGATFVRFVSIKSMLVPSVWRGIEYPSVSWYSESPQFDFVNDSEWAQTKNCFHPVSNRGPFACEANVITTTLWKLWKKWAIHMDAFNAPDLQTCLQWLAHIQTF